MRLVLLLVAGFLLPPLSARADDASLPADVVTATKRATVFIQVQGSTWKGSGSGFVVKVDKETLLIATNYHVLAGPASERNRPSPSDVLRVIKASAVTVVFDSGTKMERSFKAEPITADAERDLAIIRVTNVKDPPAPIDHSVEPKLTETMAVYSFGFPFGKALSTGSGSPAVTVGKASISSIRLDEFGELSIIQIDGNLNPGNSGGPVVDVKGKLVGVAVATIKDGQGIGLAVPSIELGRAMAGRLSEVHTSTTRGTDGKVTVKAEVGLIDPANAVRGVVLHYVPIAPNGMKPGRGESLEKHPGLKKLVLKIEGGIASGEITFDKAEGELFLQAVPDGELKKFVASSVRGFPLAGLGGGTTPEPGAKPPAGWKEVIPRDRAFTVWIPEKPVRQAERDRNSVVGGQLLRTSVLHVELAGGLVYQVERLILPPAISVRIKRPELEGLFRDAIVNEMKGRVTESADVKMGAIPGREYLIDSSKGQARIRIFVGGAGRVFILHVVGNREQLTANDATIFLNSCRLPSGPVSPKVEGPVIAGGSTKILGGGPDAEFKDAGPAGALLVGFEVGIGKFLSSDVVKAIRPIYRAGDKESFGQQRGTEIKQLVKVVAKPGYAVGAITVKAGLGMNGFSVTFMKVVNGKLDPKDVYESDWIGDRKGGGLPTKLGGDGTPVVGLIGKSNPKDFTGMGLLLGSANAGGGNVAVNPVKSPKVGPKDVPVAPKTDIPLSADTSPAVMEAVGKLNSPDKAMRRAGAEQLIKIKPDANREQVAKALEGLMNDPDIFVLGSVTRALINWGGKENVPGLVVLTADKGIFVRGHSMDVLAALKDERGAEACAKRLVDGFDRGKASQSLKAMGSIAEPAVLKRISSDSKEVRVEVCRILKDIGTKACVTALEEASKDTDADIAREAAAALAKVKR